MLGTANTMAHVYYKLLVLDGHQAAFAQGLEFHTYRNVGLIFFIDEKS